METIYRISDFLHYVPVSNDVVALYNALTFGVVFVEQRTAEFLQDVQGGIFGPSQLPMSGEAIDEFVYHLKQRRIVFPLGQRDDLNDYLHMQELLRKQGIGIVYLMLTDGCNLACRYCYIERRSDAERSIRLMSVELINEALEKFAEIVDRNLIEPQVVLYGGEPLLNRSGVLHAIDRVAELKRDGRLPEGTGITLNTNGTLIDDAFVDSVRGKEIQIALSLDGEAVEHDAMRPFRGGQGSFSAVMRACERMKQGGVDFGFSVTINGRNIDRLEEILLWVHKTFGAMSIGFNILVDRQPELLGMTEEEYGKRVTEKLISCFKIARELGIYEDRIMRKVDAFIRGYPYLYDCGAPGDQIVVTPAGMVGVCQAYGSTGKNFVPLATLAHTADHPIWNQWRFRSPLYQKQCVDCIALGLCGGGCPYSADVRTGSIWGLDEVFCTHARGTVEFLLRDLFAQTTH